MILHVHVPQYISMMLYVYAVCQYTSVRYSQLLSCIAVLESQVRVYVYHQAQWKATDSCAFGVIGSALSHIGLH